MIFKEHQFRAAEFMEYLRHLRPDDLEPVGGAIAAAYCVKGLLSDFVIETDSPDHWERNNNKMAELYQRLGMGYQLGGELAMISEFQKRFEQQAEKNGLGPGSAIRKVSGKIAGQFLDLKRQLKG